MSEANGPLCDTCSESQWYNFYVPDDVWEKIAPLDVPGGGALCVLCIDKRCVELGINTVGRFHFVGDAVSAISPSREVLEKARDALASLEPGYGLISNALRALNDALAPQDPRP